MIRIYNQADIAQAWIDRFRQRSPCFACVLGFTETGLVPGISAAGATPADRQYTAIADAEFLSNGAQLHPQYPLPPLTVGASPTLISRAVIATQTIPLHLFDAGLPVPPPVPCVNLGGQAAGCVSSGEALPLEVVKYLLHQGLQWGEKLSATFDYLIVGECVVGGTTTALAVLTGLGWDAAGKVNSSHPHCNHAQKWAIVQAGLARSLLTYPADPCEVVAAVGDPMQIVVAGIAIAASQRSGVLLAGGTQMLAVYALARSIAQTRQLWHPEQVVVGTTRWVADDPTGDTVGLANLLEAPLLATQLNLTHSRHPQLRAYEQGYVKEGVGAGGCAIAAHLYQNWDQPTLLEAIDTAADQLLALH